MRLFVSFFCALVLAVLPRIALAQMVQINPTLKMSLPRLDANGNSVQKRDPSLNPEGINLQDCRDNLQIQVPLILSGFVAGDVVEVWATDSGGDCSASSTNRSGPVAVCYRLDKADIPLNTNPTVNLSIKDIIAGLPMANPQKDTNGCRLTQAPIPIDVQFLFFHGGDNQAATAKDDVSFTVKTVGPPPLTGLRVQPGNTRVTISWNAIGEGGVEDILGVQAYCNPSPVATAVTSQPQTQTVCDSGTYIDDGGNDSGNEAGTVVTFDAGCIDVTTGGSSSSSGAIPPPSPGFSSDGIACNDSVLIGDGGTTVTDEAGVTTSGYIPGHELDKFKCGSAFGPTASTIVAGDIGGTPITNGHTIAVAVAGTDSYNNLGDLTSPICQFPEQTTDFWNDYKNAGGGAGGCAVTSDGTRPAGLLGFSAAALALAVASLKRVQSRWRRRR